MIGLNEDFSVVCFDSSFDDTFNHESYSVQFSFNPLHFYRLHRTIDIATKMFNEKFLFPNKMLEAEKTQINVYLDPMYQLRYKTTEKVLPWFNKSLNDYQKEAVLNVLRGECRQMPYIIFGPPGMCQLHNSTIHILIFYYTYIIFFIFSTKGTGKTTTLIEIIFQLRAKIPKSSILICSQSNRYALVFIF